MSRRLAIDGLNCPAIAGRMHFVYSEIDHRFHSERHTFFQLQPCSGFPVIWNGRIFVQISSDAVSDQIPDNRKTGSLHMMLNGERDVVKIISFNSLVDAFI